MELLRIIAAGGCGIVIGLIFGYIVGSDNEKEINIEKNEI